MTLSDKLFDLVDDIKDEKKSIYSNADQDLIGGLLLLLRGIARTISRPSSEDKVYIIKTKTYGFNGHPVWTIYEDKAFSKKEDAEQYAESLVYSKEDIGIQELELE